MDKANRNYPANANNKNKKWVCKQELRIAKYVFLLLREQNYQIYILYTHEQGSLYESAIGGCILNARNKQKDLQLQRL